MVFANVLPSKRTSPESIGINPDIILMRVDFPQPLGPKIEIIFPLGISKSKFLYKTEPLKDLSSPRIVT